MIGHFDLSNLGGQMSDSRLMRWIIRTILRLVDLIWPPSPEPEPLRFVFRKVVDVGTGRITMGDIIMVKRTFGAHLRFSATPEGPAGSKYEEGTEDWQVTAQYADGSDASADYALEVNPDNALEADVIHSGTRESTALVTLRADGDEDVDESEPVVGTESIIIDTPNVTGFALSVTDVTEEPEPTPEPTPEP